MKRLGVDVGGTFTDLIYVDDEAGQILVHKLPTTPEDPSQGTVQGIAELAENAGSSPSELDQVFHGTTIATNIVIEHDGAQVGLITPVVHKTFPLEQAREAMEMMQRREHFGKIVLKP